ncbi:MAG: segregation and condensation protein A [Candidatus Aminicenantia bacterium]
MMEDGFRIELGFFEGPLDLLLFLVKKEEVSIWEIPLAQITEEYLRYLGEKKFINPSREADFLLVASILIHLKSSRLFPKIKINEEEEDEEYLLRERIETYGIIKNFAESLRKLEDSVYFLGRGKIEKFDEEEVWKIFSLYEIAKAFVDVAKRKEIGESIPYRDRRISIDEKMSELLKELKLSGSLKLLSYLENVNSSEEIIVIFLAFLELIRQGFVYARQRKEFGEIELKYGRRFLDERRAHA